MQYSLECFVLTVPNCVQLLTAGVHGCPTEDAGIQWVSSLLCMGLKAHCSMQQRL